MYLGKPVNLRGFRLIGPTRFGPSFIDSVIPGPPSSPFIAFISLRPMLKMLVPRIQSGDKAGCALARRRERATG